jgi:hypothetical protein
MGVLSAKDEYTGPAFECIKCVPVAWFASQGHSQGRVNEAHSHSYLFKSQWNIRANSKILTFPHNDKIQSLAATVARQRGEGGHRSLIRRWTMPRKTLVNGSRRG